MKKIFKFLGENPIYLILIFWTVLVFYHSPTLFILYCVFCLGCAFPDLIKKAIWAFRDDYWYQSLREDFVNLFKKNGR